MLENIPVILFEELIYILLKKEPGKYRDLIYLKI
jgi:hypothetical protein